MEFKKTVGEWKEAVETISAFANIEGGRIIIGISQTGKLLGVEIGKGTIEDLTNKISQNIDPKIRPRVTMEKMDGKSLIMIEVKESSDHLVLAFGRPYKRVGRSSVQMSKDEYERSILEKHKDKLQFDRQVCRGASLKDIDGEKVKWFLKEARKQRGLKISTGAELNSVLRQLRLLQDGKLTNAALLLFGRETQFIQSEVKCIRFKGNEPVKPYIDFQTLTGNVFDLVDQSLDFVLRNIKKSIWLSPGKVQREEKYEYPTEAIREAIVNAVVHRDYLSPSKVQVRVFDDYIEIWNPGELPKGWTVEKLRQEHESIPKNPLLFKQLFWVKYVEDVGGGTLDIINECKEWDIAEPEFKDTGTAMIVTFGKPVFTPEVLAKLGLNERQMRAMEYLKQTGKISNRSYKGLFPGITDKTIYRDLQDLVRKSIVKSIGRKKGRHYILK